jgi:hypothetical protein
VPHSLQELIGVPILHASMPSLALSFLAGLPCRRSQAYIWRCARTSTIMQRGQGIWQLRTAVRVSPPSAPAG